MGSRMEERRVNGALVQGGWPLDEAIVRIALARTLELFLGLEREGMRSTAEFAILPFVIYLPYNGGGRLSRMDEYFDIVAELESAAVDLSADQVFRLIADDDVRTTIRFLRGRSETTLDSLRSSQPCPRPRRERSRRRPTTRTHGSPSITRRFLDWTTTASAFHPKTAPSTTSRSRRQSTRVWTSKRSDDGATRRHRRRRTTSKATRGLHGRSRDRRRAGDAVRNPKRRRLTPVAGCAGRDWICGRP